MTSVRFIGGPYDGHCNAPLEEPADRITLKVSLDVFAALDGQRTLGDAPITSLAVYDFDPNRGAYLFVGQLAASGWPDE